MYWENMWKLFIVSILLVQGCATQKIALYSTELPSKITTDQISKSRIAIMPVAGRITSKENISKLKKGITEYINFTSESDEIIGLDKVETLMSERPELLSTYETLLTGLVDYDQMIGLSQDDGKLEVEQIPWDGQRGLNYKNISALNGNNGSKVSFDWFITMKKGVDDPNILLSSVDSLSNALNSDYLLIPVILDKYRYIKNLGMLLIIPVAYTYQLTYSSDIAFYLIDGNSAKIVRASVGYNLTPVMVAASLQKILDKGQFAGKISLVQK